MTENYFQDKGDYAEIETSVFSHGMCEQMMSSLDGRPEGASFQSDATGGKHLLHSYRSRWNCIMRVRSDSDLEEFFVS